MCFNNLDFLYSIYGIKRALQIDDRDLKIVLDY